MLEQILARDPGYRGLLTYTLPESLWLAGQGFDDLVIGYPTADRTAIAELARLTDERPDDGARADGRLARAPRPDRGAPAGPGDSPIRVAMELDVGLVGAGRAAEDRAQALPDPHAAAGRRASRGRSWRRPRLKLVGLMAYEGHIAGLGDRPPGKRLQGRVIEWMQSRSAEEIRERRAAVVAAVSELAELEFVNGGGTGSLHGTTGEDAVTELAAGSGFFAPTLFDTYSSFKLRPAAMFAMPVVRKPSAVDRDRAGRRLPRLGRRRAEPRPLPPPARRPAARPLRRRGRGADPGARRRGPRPAVGDRVYFRHTKAGELCERFDSLHLVSGDRVVDEVPTYRGEGRTFL